MNVTGNFSGKPSVDLFASRENAKVEKYCSWRADLGAWQIDAFSFPWVNDFFYIFRNLGWSAGSGIEGDLKET